MAFRAVISSKIPMVIILGATGTGKTKLSVELAQKFGTEIISADSMQIYKGLDIVTAKASLQEREMAKHHLLDILEPHQMFTVVDFRNRALKLIENLIADGKMPIIVGGTSYYIESVVYKILVESMDDDLALLWDMSRRKRDFDDNEKHDEVATKIPKLLETNDDKVVREPTTSRNNETHTKKEGEEHVLDNTSKEQLKLDVDNEKNFTNEEIHAKLKAIDPVMAQRHHPNNRRKILRSIEVWLKTGRRHSDILAEQKLSEGLLRRPDSTIILWLKCDQAVHDERLNSRVDAMVQEGLIAELLDFHERHNKHRMQGGEPPDYTKGVFQTLGFKEFHEYLMLSDEEKASQRGQELLQKSIDNMKTGTRRYARKQNKTIRGRFLEHPTRQVPPIYELDTTDVAMWDENVKNKAINIIESFLNDSPCSYEAIKPNVGENKKFSDVNSYNYCDVCQRIIIGDSVFTIHLNSIRHKKVLKRKKKNDQETPKQEESSI